MALKMTNVYVRAVKESDEACPICGARRADLNAHLRRVHLVTRKTEELKGLGRYFNNNNNVQKT